MSDSKKWKPDDLSRIGLFEDFEIRYWCRQFKCTIPELKHAVHEVGNHTEKVEVYLQQHKDTKG